MKKQHWNHMRSMLSSTQNMHSFCSLFVRHCSFRGTVSRVFSSRDSYQNIALLFQIWVGYRRRYSRLLRVRIPADEKARQVKYLGRSRGSRIPVRRWRPPVTSPSTCQKFTWPAKVGFGELFQWVPKLSKLYFSNGDMFSVHREVENLKKKYLFKENIIKTAIFYKNKFFWEQYKDAARRELPAFAARDDGARVEGVKLDSHDRFRWALETHKVL